MAHPPLVLVHGLWDTPRLFKRLRTALDGQRDPLLIPHLEHGLGHVPLIDLARRLDQHINAAFGHDTIVDLLGFSMGGLVSRAWIQEFGGHQRTRRFLCVGSPQRGTLTAQLVPRVLLAGIADMKLGSPFLRSLQTSLKRHPERLASLDCRSFYCRTDLMVIPSWLGVLPVGSVQSLPARTHPGLVNESRSLARLIEVLLEP
jgi:triacylglycerol lipase